MKNKELYSISEHALKQAKAFGASEVKASTFKRREVSTNWRDGKIEKISESTEKGLTLNLYVEGRYSTVSTSDLRKDALNVFIEDSIQFARVLAQDPYRQLPDPSRYKGQTKEDLQIADANYKKVTPELRRQIVKRIEHGARSAGNQDFIISVSTSFNDTFTEEVRLHSNGFEGAVAGTSFSNFVEVSGKDAEGRRPQEYAYAAKRHYGDLPTPESVGEEGVKRVMSRMGSKKVGSETLTMVLDNRAVGRFAGNLLGPLSGNGLQQKQSCFEGMQGKAIGSKLWSITDNPHVIKGLGSRYYDREGMAAVKMPVIENGILKNYYIDTYYGKKLNMPATTASPSNADWKLGNQSKEQLIQAVKRGIFVTGFIGGNSNSTTGDFSLGVQGFFIENGNIAYPISEMNISGNLTSFWHNLIAVGNDPFPYSPLQSPTLVFDKVEFAGT